MSTTIDSIDAIIYECGYEYAKIMDKHKGQLSQVKWPDGESNLDTGFSNFTIHGTDNDASCRKDNDASCRKDNNDAQHHKPLTVKDLSNSIRQSLRIQPHTTLLRHMILSGKYDNVKQIMYLMLRKQQTGWSLEREVLNDLLKRTNTTHLSIHIINHICEFFPPPIHHFLDIDKKTFFFNHKKSCFIDEQHIVMTALDEGHPEVAAILTLYWDRIFV